MTEMECKCGSKLYGYKDDYNHEIYICFKCGKFEGTSNHDKEFLKEVMDDPAIILLMIQDKEMRPF